MINLLRNHIYRERENMDKLYTEVSRSQRSDKTNVPRVPSSHNRCQIGISIVESDRQGRARSDCFIPTVAVFSIGGLSGCSRLELPPTQLAGYHFFMHLPYCYTITPHRPLLLF